MSDPNKITFTAFLEDEYTRRMDAMAERSAQNVRDIERRLNDLSASGGKAADAVDQVNDRLAAVEKVRDISINTKDIANANAEIAALGKKKELLGDDKPEEIKVKVDADTAPAERSLSQLETQRSRLGEPNKVAVNTAEVEAAKNKVELLGKKKDSLKKPTPLGVNDKPAAKSIKDIDRQLKELTKARKILINTSDIKKADAEIKALLERKKQLQASGGGSMLSEVGGDFLGAIGSGLKVVGIGTAAIGAMALPALKKLGSDAYDATVRFQKYEAVLTNTLGSSSAAKQSMEQLNDFANKTPFQVDELTNSFVKLANQGFKPTMQQMTALGDIAASKGKSFDQLTEALIDAEVGEFERLKEFGIRASKENDKVTFTFKGQQKTVKLTQDAIRGYILSLGQATGVTGAMAAISKTTGGQVSNMQDNYDMLAKALGERFTPEINAGIAALNNMITTVRTWVEIPVTEKLKNETFHYQMLRTELGFSNTTEERRKAILDEIKSALPGVIDATKSEAEQLRSLIPALDAVIGKYKEKISLSLIGDKYGKELAASAEAKSITDNNFKKQTEIIGMAAARGAQLSGSVWQQYAQAKEFYKDLVKRGVKTNFKPVERQGSGMLMGAGGGTYLQSEEERMVDLSASITTQNTKALELWKKNEAGYTEAKKAQAKIDALTNSMTKPSQVATPPGSSGTSDGTGKKDKGGSSGSSKPESIQGGQKITHIITNIQNLMSGDVNIHSTTVKEGAAQMTAIVQEALLTAVNDVNYAGS